MLKKVDTERKQDLKSGTAAPKKYVIDRRDRPDVKFNIPENVGPRMSVILELAKERKISINELCEKSNINRTGLYAKLAKDDCRLSDYEKMLDTLGYEIEVVRKY